MERTFLDVPNAMREYALRNGAQVDAETRRLFVVGEVPAALLSFAPRQPRDRMDDHGPACPLCGSDTRMRYRRDSGAAFWGCTRYPKCKGTINAEDRHGGQVAAFIRKAFK